MSLNSVQENLCFWGHDGGELTPHSRVGGVEVFIELFLINDAIQEKRREIEKETEIALFSE